ncbi:hypothetical protein, partial [Rufibacter ruber]|uniref:hypothetical protein n=1 Tax=Rufibacter ruber TaxID=1783499 RepID=UPI0019D38FF5
MFRNVRREREAQLLLIGKVLPALHRKMIWWNIPLRLSSTSCATSTLCISHATADGLARFLAKTVGGQFRRLQNPTVLKLAENRSLTVHYSAYTTEIQQTNI